VTKDRVISTGDPDARHGHKSSARGFDGYKAHIGIDPDSEIITATTVTAGNAGDAEPLRTCSPATLRSAIAPPAARMTTTATARKPRRQDNDDDALAVYGDAAYGAGGLLAKL